MTPAARVQAAIAVLDEILGGKPAEQALTGWARRSRFAGSKDRAAVRDHVFDALRCKRSFAALGGAMTGRGLMLGGLRAAGADLDVLFDGSAYGPTPLGADETGRDPEPGAEAGDLPDWLWPEFCRSLGDAAEDGAAYLRQRAPVFLRAHAARTRPDTLASLLAAEGITAEPHPGAETALEVTAGARRLRGSKAFAEGLFDLQDVASQAVVEALPLTAGQRVLDYCAGGGGKALAMAARAAVEVTAHDANPGRMRDLPNRAQRAGQSIACVTEVRGTYDLVICDVPCSGSGSWRRSPEGKWTLSAEGLAELNRTQDAILDKAAHHVAPGGGLAYVTCSVLTSENEDRVMAFLNRMPEWGCTAQKRWQLQGGGDGFFLAILARK